MLTTAMLLLRGNLFLSLHLAGSSGSFPRPLSPEEEQMYLARCAEGDLEARNVLVERNMRLVAHIINNGYTERKVFVGGEWTGCVSDARQIGEYLLEGDPVDFLPKQRYKKDMVIQRPKLISAGGLI